MMKARLCLAFAVAILGDQALRGAETGEPGVLFVNAVGEKGRAFLVINGEDANPAGFAEGAVTGWVHFPEGEVKLVAEHQPWGKVELPLKLEVGDLKAILLHPELAEPDRPGRPERLAAGVLLVDCKADAAKGNNGEGRERRVVAINATLTRDISVKIGTEVCTLRRLKPVEVMTETEGGFISVKDEGTFDADVSLEGAKVEGEKRELLVLNMEDPRARWVVFFQDPEGKLKAVEFAAGGSAVVLEDR
jgi:hypothetical protein